MKVLLYEHASSGGFADQPIPGNLLSEGYGMLRGLATDFKKAGFEVVVLLDSRIAQLNPPLNADQIVKIGSEGEADPSMEEAAETADLAYVIAPEPNHVLQSIVECIETTSSLSLNSRGAAIQQVSDKANVFDTSRKLNLDFPKTLNFTSNTPNDKIHSNINKKLAYPIIIKPSQTSGCSGLSFVTKEQQLDAAVGKAKRESANGAFLAQQYIEGTPVSVSIICNGQEAVPITLNLQNITLSPSTTISSYNGGLVPFEHRLKQQAFDAAKHLVEAFKGLRGYIGVDLVLTKDGVFVIEINPRLTTSYIGLHEISEFNLADCITNAITKNVLPKNLNVKDYCCFKKLQANASSPQIWRHICNEESVVSPPFPTFSAQPSYALIKAKGNSPFVVSKNLLMAKKRVEKLMAGGG
jgi:tyramine---L-glutamate ligase